MSRSRVARGAGARSGQGDPSAGGTPDERCRIARGRTGPPGPLAATTAEALERTYRDAYGRVLATLIRSLGGDFDAAEEAVADALLAAARTWPRDGVPQSPAAWLTTAARRRAIDRLRRNHRSDRGPAELAGGLETVEEGPMRLGTDGPIEDDRLRLVFTCCHPALAIEARVALTLRTLGGLTTHEIARAFLVPEPVLAQRLVRAKRKIREARIPYRVPDATELQERLDGVLTTLYLVFNEGYLASSGESLVRADLCAEAIRLAGIVAELLPDAGEPDGLLSLLLLQDSRRGARLDACGEIVLLAAQDRSRWDGGQIARGIDALERGFAAAADAERPPGRFLLQAAIAAEHARTVDGRAPDWERITALYATLSVIDPSPVVELNRAVALAEAHGPAVALDLVDRLAGSARLAGYHLLPATRADLLRRLGRWSEAAAEYERAIGLTGNDAERRLLQRRLDEVRAEA